MLSPVALLLLIKDSLFSVSKWSKFYLVRKEDESNWQFLFVKARDLHPSYLSYTGIAYVDS